MKIINKRKKRKYFADGGERRIRSMVKAVSWRVGGTIVTILVSFILTRKLILALSIGLIDSLVKIFAFYAHERIWNKIEFGRI